MWSWVKRNRTNFVFSALNSRTNFLNFSKMKGNEFLNSVLTKILKMKSSFFRIFILKFVKFLKISNSIGQFSLNR
jgi:hypothetical protein